MGEELDRQGELQNYTCRWQGLVYQASKCADPLEAVEEAAQHWDDDGAVEGDMDCVEVENSAGVCSMWDVLVDTVREFTAQPYDPQPPEPGS